MPPNKTCHRCTQPATIQRMVVAFWEYSVLPEYRHGNYPVYANRKGDARTIIYLCDDCAHNELGQRPFIPLGDF